MQGSEESSSIVVQEGKRVVEQQVSASVLDPSGLALQKNSQESSSSLLPPVALGQSWRPNRLRESGAGEALIRRLKTCEARVVHAEPVGAEEPIDVEQILSAGRR